MSNRIRIPYSEAELLIEEGDVLLFRGTGLVSNLIQSVTQSEYSHVAIASRHNGNWEVVEFREWYGGRIVDLENYLSQSRENKTEIDVYRPCKYFSKITFDPQTYETAYHREKFDGKKVTRCMREYTGLPYSYKRIWLILKIHLLRLHVIRNLEHITNDLPNKDLVYPVCSTVLSHCFKMSDYAILNRRNDQYIEPGHFANSPRLNYLFTPVLLTY